MQALSSSPAHHGTTRGSLGERKRAAPRVSRRRGTGGTTTLALPRAWAASADRGGARPLPRVTWGRDPQPRLSPGPGQPGRPAGPAAEPAAGGGGAALRKEAKYIGGRVDILLFG